VGWKDVTMARPYPKEFREDVVRVARNREDGVTIEAIAADFGVHLFVSPRTVQKTHLTHVYTKLGLTSRVQLVRGQLGTKTLAAMVAPIESFCESPARQRTGACDTAQPIRG
jgi:transposase-like protein